ncbi:unnamed protein product [Urochloa humidicola]
MVDQPSFLIGFGPIYRVHFSRPKQPPKPLLPLPVPTHCAAAAGGSTRRRHRRRVTCVRASPCHWFSGPAGAHGGDTALAPWRAWADIPPELAGLVLGRLPAHIDRVRFASVCPQWRSAAGQVRLPPPPPLMVLKSGGTFYSMPRSEALHFTGCEEGFVTVSGNWLVYHRTHCLLLVDPFTDATMTLPAPSVDCLPAEGDYSVCKTPTPSVAAKHFSVIKLMVCSPDLVAALFVFGTSFNKIAVCRPGASMWSIVWDQPLWIIDLAFYQGKLYAVHHAAGRLAVDISMDDNTGDPRVAPIEHVIEINDFDDILTFERMLYLVESGGSLLLVSRNIFCGHMNGKGHIHFFAGQCEPDVAIFEADFGQSQWVEVTSLGDDQALFLGPCSRAVHMPKGDSLGNRVWFLDDYKDFYLWDKYEDSSCSGTSGMANHPMPFCPLPMISWGSYQGRAGAAWLFPST